VHGWLFVLQQAERQLHEAEERLARQEAISLNSNEMAFRSGRPCAKHPHDDVRNRELFREHLEALRRV
jgi:hypothetical protein